jgi:serine/threonine-protein kinase
MIPLYFFLRKSLFHQALSANFMQKDVKTELLPAIEDYEILDIIGQGGIAQIYKARQKSLGRLVAIKILFPELTHDPEIVRRFDREAITIAALNHPNIVHVIDKGNAGGRYYFVMEYVDGSSFKEIIYDHKYPIRDKLEIIVTILKGLHYAHKNGVIHRDIKPANILIDRNGNALLADFGIAQILNANDPENTKLDVVMGTMAYMSPEQRESSALVDLTTDIFAVGVMIYEILTGKRPLGKFRMPSELNSKIPKRFDDIVAHCLDENPSARYQSAVELKDDLLNAIAGRARGGTDFKREMGGVESFIGKCRYLDTIRSSKFSATVLVENIDSRELYVIKKHEQSSAGLKEARILANLKHNNIINIFGAGGDARRMTVMMEYAPGGSLVDRMVKTYPYEKAMDIIIPTAEALDFAHKNNIIHGNLRPANILFTREDKIKVTDFGLPPHYSMTEKNWYAPPEREVSRQADIFALGVIMHQLLFGKNPEYDREGKLFLGNLEWVNPDAINTILAKTLALRTAERYRSIGELLHEWEDFRSSLSPKHTPGIPAHDKTELLKSESLWQRILKKIK